MTNLKPEAEAPAAKADRGRKADETRGRILEAALSVFRERGFERATMREIAAEAGVAVGAAYYYFDSKDALVLAFYEAAQAVMNPEIEAALDKAKTLEQRLRAIISAKFSYFAENRRLLGALSAHADPEHPLSPFSAETTVTREQDQANFERAVRDSKLKLPSSVAPYMGRLLWLYQMGLLLFWVYDRSPDQQRTSVMYEQTLKLLMLGLRVAGLPFLSPLYRTAGDLLRFIYGDAPAA